MKNNIKYADKYSWKKPREYVEREAVYYLAFQVFPQEIAPSTSRWHCTIMHCRQKICTVCASVCVQNEFLINYALCMLHQ